MPTTDTTIDGTVIQDLTIDGEKVVEATIDGEVFYSFKPANFQITNSYVVDGGQANGSNTVVAATVTNQGTETGSKNVNANGWRYEDRTITLNSGESQTVKFDQSQGPTDYGGDSVTVSTPDDTTTISFNVDRVNGPFLDAEWISTSGDTRWEATNIGQGTTKIYQVSTDGGGRDSGKDQFVETGESIGFTDEYFRYNDGETIRPDWRAYNDYEPTPGNKPSRTYG